MPLLWVNQVYVCQMCGFQGVFGEVCDAEEWHGQFRCSHIQLKVFWGQSSVPLYKIIPILQSDNGLICNDLLFAFRVIFTAKCILLIWAWPLPLNSATTTSANPGLCLLTWSFVVNQTFETYQMFSSWVDLGGQTTVCDCCGKRCRSAIERAVLPGQYGGFVFPFSTPYFFFFFAAW